MTTKFADDQIEEMLERMEKGETLTSIGEDPRMPSIRSMMLWEDKQDDLGCRITQARARGFTVRAEAAVMRAQAAEDPQLGRLDFDAERWFLGKMHPKKFGDKIDVTSGGEAVQMDDTAIAVRVAALLKTALARDESE